MFFSSYCFRKKEDCGNLYEGIVDLNKLPKHPSKTSYKYCIEVDGKFEWEKIYHQKDCNAREISRIPNQQAMYKGNGQIKVRGGGGDRGQTSPRCLPTKIGEDM